MTIFDFSIAPLPLLRLHLATEEQKNARVGGVPKPHLKLARIHFRNLHLRRCSRARRAFLRSFFLERHPTLKGCSESTGNFEEKFVVLRISSFYLCLRAWPSLSAVTHRARATFLRKVSTRGVDIGADGAFR